MSIMDYSMCMIRKDLWDLVHNNYGVGASCYWLKFSLYKTCVQRPKLQYINRNLQIFSNSVRYTGMYVTECTISLLCLINNFHVITTSFRRIVNIQYFL
jgi:hypothetical protein